MDDLSEQCMWCGGPLREEHSHMRCRWCGMRDSCCDGEQLPTCGVDPQGVPLES